MLLVKTKIGVSKIDGIGLFADQFIAKGTPVWRFKKGFDVRVNKKYPETLSEPAKSFFKKYAYQNPKTLNWTLPADNARFANHSNTANIYCGDNLKDENSADIASRDIQPGEELTNDYREFDSNPFFGFKKSKT
jgi:uncharacterized protein